MRYRYSSRFNRKHQYKRATLRPLRRPRPTPLGYATAGAYPPSGLLSLLGALNLLNFRCHRFFAKGFVGKNAHRPEVAADAEHLLRENRTLNRFLRLQREEFPQGLRPNLTHYSQDHWLLTLALLEEYHIWAFGQLARIHHNSPELARRFGELATLKEEGAELLRQLLGPDLVVTPQWYHWDGEPTALLAEIVAKLERRLTPLFRWRRGALLLGIKGPKNRIGHMGAPLRLQLSQRLSLLTRLDGQELIPLLLRICWGLRRVRSGGGGFSELSDPALLLRGRRLRSRLRFEAVVPYRFNLYKAALKGEQRLIILRGSERGLTLVSQLLTGLMPRPFRGLRSRRRPVRRGFSPPLRRHPIPKPKPFPQPLNPWVMWP